MLEFALRYIRLGWPVLPLRGKLPLGQAVEHGSKGATTDEAQVRAWWERWPNANIGLATSHKFFAVDVDARHGGEESWDLWRTRYGALPDTIEQITGTGGKHVLFALPDFPVHNSQGKLAPGIDVRGEGGYIMAAPSVHPETRRRYAWDGAREIEDQMLAPAPEWLLRMLRVLDAPGRRQPAAPLAEKIGEGRRNDTLFRTAARLRRFGFSAEEICASLGVINRNRCSPPLPEEEVRRIAESASRYKPDGKATVFRCGAPAASQENAENVGELPLGQADVEAAIQNAIAHNDVQAAIALAAEVAKMSPVVQALIENKLRRHFKKDFPARLFEKALRGSKVVEITEAPADKTAVSPLGPDLLGYPLTDSGNGERLVTLFGGDLRFCVEMDKWLVWDETRWAMDDCGLASQKAKQMARQLFAQAGAFPEHLKWARKSESQERIVAALKRAATEPGVAIHASELDQHPYLLNCENGVVDLRTGELLPPDRRYLITKMCHVRYDPAAECPRFERFLEWAMGGNIEAEITPRTSRLVSFLQRAFGYSLTGDISEKVVFIFWGPEGNNGKTTLLTVFQTLLSEYSTQILVESLMTVRASDLSMRADLADLRGARFVTTSEVEKEHRLTEGKLKYLTAGMGKIKGERKHENPILFKATHKLFMDCNYRPQVRGTDNAIWRRLKPVPFEVTITEDDPAFDKNLADKLIAEGVGILAWAVRGCRAWMEEGLGDPPEITQANAAWREHDDPLKDFLEDCCEAAPDAWVRNSELADTYAWWCKRNHERFPLGREPFNERIVSKGFRYSRSRRSVDGKQMRTWEGLRVRDEVSSQVRAAGALLRPLPEPE